LSTELTAAILGRTRLFQNLPGSLLAKLAADARDVYLLKGGVLFRKGDSCDGFYTIVYGRFKVSIFSRFGLEKPLQIAEQGDTLGDITMFRGVDHYVTAVAIQDSKLLYTPRSTITELLSTDVDLVFRIMRNLTRRTQLIVDDIEAFSMQPPAVRLVCYLLRLAQPDAVTDVNIRLKVDKKLMAAQLNLTPETLSRYFRLLQDKELISVDGRQITIRSISDLENFV
jgi:CRP-like cAMP-binding protein